MASRIFIWFAIFLNLFFAFWPSFNYASTLQLFFAAVLFVTEIRIFMRNRKLNQMRELLEVAAENGDYASFYVAVHHLIQMHAVSPLFVFETLFNRNIETEQVNWKRDGF